MRSALVLIVTQSWGERLHVRPVRVPNSSGCGKCALEMKMAGMWRQRRGPHVSGRDMRGCSERKTFLTPLQEREHSHGGQNKAFLCCPPVIFTRFVTGSKPGILKDQIQYIPY